MHWAATGFVPVLEVRLLPCTRCPNNGAHTRKGRKLSAKVSVEFDDGRKMLWALPVDPDGEAAVQMLTANIGHPTSVRQPLNFEPFALVNGAYIADSFNGQWTYLIVVKNYGREAALYQLAAGEELCPVNAERAERFQRFSVEFGDKIPWGEALCAAQEWDDVQNGWGADDVI